MSKTNKNYYAVHKGYNPGIYTSWSECEKEVKKFVGAEYKKFSSKEDAEEFVKTGYGNNKPKALSKIIKADKANNDKIEEECNVDEEDKIYIYTDGSLIRGKQIIAGYGIYIPSKDIKIALPLVNQKLTNNRAELTAIIESINYLDENDLKKKICIFTDSQYSIYIMTGTGYRYAKNGYKDKNGKDVPNIDLIKKALILVKKYNIVLLKVRSHTNAKDEHSINNDIVDKLAIKGANKSKEYEGANSFADISFYIDNEKNSEEEIDNITYDSDEERTLNTTLKSSLLLKSKTTSKEHSTNFFKIIKSTDNEDDDIDDKIEVKDIDEVEEDINNFKQNCKKIYNNNDKNYINSSIQMNELFEISENKDIKIDELKTSKTSNKKGKLTNWFIKSVK